MTTIPNTAIAQSIELLAACDALRGSYNEMPIGSSADWTTHPNALAAVAWLHGMNPASVTNCRVLELGCACGGNIVPLAFALPGSRFVGVDISDVQIQKARDLAAQAGVTNLELRAANILDLEGNLGTFDYIFCDGVFSWVPPAVQEQIFRLFAACLSPQGVAYLSFNAYPGWHVRGIVRDFLRIHACNLPDPQTRTAAARSLLAQLEASAAADKSPLALIRGELDMLRDSTDSYLYHEHLVEHNTSFFFRDVMQRAAEHGLAYLAEIQPLNAETERIAAGIVPDPAERVQLQQAADFLEVAQYHGSLLYRNDLSISRPTSDRLRSLLIGTNFQPTSDDPDVTTAKAEEFTRPGGNLTTEHPFVKAAIVALAGCRPAPIPYKELWQKVRELLLSGPNPFPLDEDVDEPSFAESLLYCYNRHIVWLRTHQTDLAISIPDKPQVTTLARAQAKSEDSVANLMHTPVKLTPLQRQLVPLLDGSRNRSDILAVLLCEVSALSLSQGPPSQQQIDEALESLARQAMFLRPTAIDVNA